MNTVDTAETRPRIRSGVAICTRFCRVNTDTTSAPPNTTSAATETVTDRETANTTVISPKSATADSIFTPARLRMGLSAR